MKKVNWKNTVRNYITTTSHSVEAKMGNVHLRCLHYKTLTGKSEWRARVSINHLSVSSRIGPYRRSLEKAKDDAARLVEEMLIDYHTGITREMKCCGVSL